MRRIAAAIVVLLLAARPFAPSSPPNVELPAPTGKSVIDGTMDKIVAATDEGEQEKLMRGYLAT